MFERVGWSFRAFGVLCFVAVAVVGVAVAVVGVVSASVLVATRLGVLHILHSHCNLRGLRVLRGASEIGRIGGVFASQPSQCTTYMPMKSFTRQVVAFYCVASLWLDRRAGVVQNYVPVDVVAAVGRTKYDSS